MAITVTLASSKLGMTIAVRSRFAFILLSQTFSPHCMSGLRISRSYGCLAYLCQARCRATSSSGEIGRVCYFNLLTRKFLAH